MNRRLSTIFFSVALLLFATAAFASPQTTAMELVQTSIASSLDKIFADLQTWTVKWLALFILLQFTWSNIGLLVSGAEWEKVWSKFLGSLFWFSICIYVFNNGPDFIKSTSNFLLSKATGTTGSTFDPFAPIEKGLEVASQLLVTLDGTKGILGSLNPFPSIMMGLVACVILAVSSLVAFKILMIFIETKIVIALSPLSFSLLGLNAFKDQGLAPFKYLVSLAYRVMILSAVITAMVVFSDSIIATFKTLPEASDPSVWPPIWAAAIGYALLGALTHRADSIAAMLASGTSQITTGDAAAVGAAAAAGAGAGAALGSAAGATGSATASSAAKVPQAMSAIMAKLGGSSGSISNASRNGAGPSPAEAPKRAASLSTASGSTSSGAPMRSSDGGAAGATTSAPGKAESGARSTPSGTADNAPTRSVTAPEPGIASAGNTMATAPSSQGPTTEASAPRPETTSAASVAQEPAALSGADSGNVTGSARSQGGPSGAPIRPATTTAGNSNTAPVRPKTPSDSGATAGIGGANSSPVDQKLDKVMEALAQQGQSPKKTAIDHLATAHDSINKVLQNDAPGAHITMSTHSDH